MARFSARTALLLLVTVMAGCAAPPPVERGSAMLAVLSDPPGAKVFLGHENTSTLLGTTPFTLTVKATPKKEGQLWAERLTAVWGSGATRRQVFRWDPSKGQHFKFVFDPPAALTAQDVDAGLRHLSTVDRQSPARQAHDAHFGWERTREMYADMLRAAAAAAAAKHGSPGSAAIDPELLRSPVAPTVPAVPAAETGTPLFRDIEVTDLFTREKYVGSVDRFGNATIRRRLEPGGSTFKGTLGSDGYGTFRDDRGRDLKVGPR